MNKSHITSIASLALVAVIFLFSGCQKDESVLNDYDLFGRLQGGNGTWKVVEVQTFQNDIPNPTITTTIPENEIFHHFYIRSLEVFGILIDVASVSIYNDGNLSAIYDCEAEKERVVYRDGEIFGGTVFSVEKNKMNKQVWNYTQGNSTTRVTLERCDCEVPHLGSIESGG